MEKLAKRPERKLEKAHTITICYGIERCKNFVRVLGF